jgi:NAD(P)-dependent dehydrogenase (short-subunit alcohol dehydrogenase family)
MEGRAALGRVVTPDDVAAAIVGFLTGPGLTTGHVLPVEGGMLISA